MPIKIKENSIAAKILFGLLIVEDLALTFFPSPYELRKRVYHGKKAGSFNTSLYRLKKSGLIEFVAGSSNKKGLRLTSRGEIEALLVKAKIPNKGKWDGKWRLIVFDIPEKDRIERNQLRDLLKRNEFVKLQASVYISPFALNREAIKYLKQTGLNRFIRIIRADELDDDKDLRKKFNLL